MTDFQMEKFQLPDPTTRCKGKPPRGWGNYGNQTVDSECADACLRDPSCKFVGISWNLWKGGVCTQFDKCDEAKETDKKLEMGGDGKLRCHSGHQTCYWWFWKKVPAPAPVPLPPVPLTVSTSITDLATWWDGMYRDMRKWNFLPGEVKLDETPVAPDGLSVGYSGDMKAPDGNDNCYMKYDMKKCRKNWSKSQRIPVEKHGDPKGVEWCAKKDLEWNPNLDDTKKGLCDKVKAKYDEVEQLEASLYQAYIKKAYFSYKFEHSTMLDRHKNQNWFRQQRDKNIECGEINRTLATALGELVALNEEIVG